MMRQQLLKTILRVFTEFIVKRIKKLWKIHHSMETPTVIMLAVIQMMTLLLLRRIIFLQPLITGNLNQDHQFYKTNDNWRTTTVRKRVFSSDTDESDDLPIFTGFYVKTPVQSQDEAKQRKLENDDQMQDKERRSQSDTVAENETDPSNEHSPSLFREVGLQSGQGRTQLNESNSTRNVHLDSRAISDENEPNDANCSDASTNLDQQQEGQEEIVDVQQEVRRQMTEDTPCTSRNLCSTGQANTFWKKCKEAKCVEMIFKKMQNDLNAIQQNIINGSATDKEYDNAWTIFLTLDSLQVLEEFQSETLQKLQLLEKEKSSLKIKECLVQEMRKIAGSLNHKSHREK
ncbi:uncharacterized protein LOC109919656 isoform X5 [Rhincodon typus]|uniref:uncharacterized protein LOC109919656 isoform X5 n=1 Tax=Rhincodon typus TaxID=259920 RepID=UPI0020301515|nr:uncharacterized protein LOC109919656 isoform X5 [Rhincodon typus]